MSQYKLGRLPVEPVDLGDLTLDNLPLYPHVSQVLTDMPERVLVDFSRMLESNLRHSVEMRRTVRTHEKASHQEVGVIYGRSTDWATTPKVLKINPYPLDKKPPLAKAARLLWHTFKEANPDKRFPDEPFYLATTGVYYDADTNERLYAEDVAIALAEFAYDVMTRSVPSMKTCLEVVPGIVYHKDRSFTPIVDFKI